MCMHTIEFIFSQVKNIFKQLKLNLLENVLHACQTKSKAYFNYKYFPGISAFIYFLSAYNYTQKISPGKKKTLENSVIYVLK